MKTKEIKKGKFLLESYGCQMNFSDSEIVASILSDCGYEQTETAEMADIILLNTCAIRENAEQKIRNRLKELNILKQHNQKIIGVLGCMAERLKHKFLEEEQLLDIVVGPDAYRDLPNLIETAEAGGKGVNVFLSKEETYADIAPVRFGSNGVSAFISIMRGCDNMCTFCVVPFTRGRERSRDPQTIVCEAKEAFNQGFREVTLLGQNVDSYIWAGGGLKKDITPEKMKDAVNFAQLLEMVAKVSPQLRIRFSTSHPKDITDEVLRVMSDYPNICKYIHLPVQSGSSAVLKKMNRGYTREWYLDKIERIRKFIPDCGISTDIITGFCDETEADHKQTLSLMEEVKFDFAYMFMYSERPGTPAERKFNDNIPEHVKKQRLQEVIELQQKHSAYHTQKYIGKVCEVLIEGNSRKSDKHWMGRNSQNTVVVFPKNGEVKGSYVNVKITSATSTTLIGERVDK